jgi:hypothetical protein
MNTVPSQVEEAAELAEQLHNQMYASEPVVEETETQEVEAAPIDTDDEEVVPHDDDVAELRKFKDRYMHLKGKYDAEVPRLSQELRELKQSVFERLDKAIKPAAEATPEVDETSEFVNAFAENYGEDFAENLRKLISLEASKLQQPVQKQIADVEETQVKAAQTNFVNYIDSTLNEGREAPVDWQGLWAGNDPNFLEFLKQPDPSGLYTYGELAELYNQNWDADKLVNIFKLYTDAQAPTVRTQPKTPKTSPQQEAMVAPSRSVSTVTPSTDSKKVWTSDMVQEFQRADRQGKYSSEDSKALWDDLLSALAENRIR